MISYEEFLTGAVYVENASSKYNRFWHFGDDPKERAEVSQMFFDIEAEEGRGRDWVIIYRGGDGELVWNTRRRSQDGHHHQKLEGYATIEEAKALALVLARMS